MFINFLTTLKYKEDTMSEEINNNNEQHEDGCNDTVYYNDGYNKITNKRFILGVHTHAVSNISSIKTNEDHYEGDDAEWNISKLALFFFGAIFGLIGFGNITSENYVLGIIFLGIGAWMIRKGMKLNWKDDGTPDWAEYKIKIVNNAGEIDHVWSKDEEKINKIFAAMNKAITENI